MRRYNPKRRKPYFAQLHHKFYLFDDPVNEINLFVDADLANRIKAESSISNEAFKVFLCRDLTDAFFEEFDQDFDLFKDSIESGINEFLYKTYIKGHHRSRCTHEWQDL